MVARRVPVRKDGMRNGSYGTYFEDQTHRKKAIVGDPYIGKLPSVQGIVDAGTRSA